MISSKPGQFSFIGRESQLNEIRRYIQSHQDQCLILIEGQGGAGKTCLLRKIYEEYATQPAYFCFELIDFYQIKNRNVAWVMDTIARQAPDVFTTYFQVTQQFLQQDNTVSTYLTMQSDVNEAFYTDLCRFEQRQRCVFLFDTIELIQETILLDLVTIIKASRQSIFVLAGRQSTTFDRQFAAELGVHALLSIQLHGFVEQEALIYIQQIPAGRDLTLEEQRVLYLLADNGIPIKLALALDWLSRGLVMESLVENNYQDLVTIRERDAQALRQKQLAFERELVTQIGRLGTLLDQTVYIMAHVSKRFNRVLLQRLVHPDNVDALIEKLHALLFVKSIENDYFVLHDEVQRMVVQHIWNWEDPTHTRRNELSQAVIGYYDENLEALRQMVAADEHIPTVRSEIWIQRIERLYYLLDVNLVAGYHEFREIFEELKDRRDQGEIELAALALDVLLSGQPLPDRLYTFVMTYGRGWVLTRRLNYLDQACVHIEQGLAQLIHPRSDRETLSEQRRLFLEQEVDQRIGEVYTLLGYNRRLAGDWAEAVRYYEHARELNERLIDQLLAQASVDQRMLRRSVSRLAETLNDIGNLQRMRGALDDARIYCKTSLLLRKSLREWRTVGHCSYVMSMIMWESGNTAEAVSYLQQAHRFYQQTGADLLDRAWVDRYTGYVMYRTGNMHAAIKLLKRALDAASTNNLHEEHAQVLIYFSRINREKGTPADLKQSLKDAETALAIAMRARNEYILVECYLTLCFTLLAMHAHDRENSDLHTRLVSFLEQGQTIVSQRAYGRLEGLFCTIRGELAFEERNYLEAFVEYLAACRHAIQFKPSAFGRASSKLITRLYDLVGEDLDATLSMCQLIRAQWQPYEDRLDESYIGMLLEVAYVESLARNGYKRRQLALTFAHALGRGAWDAAMQACDEADNLPMYQHRDRAAVFRQRAEVYHNTNRFSLARFVCERAVRIYAETSDPSAALGDSYLLLSRICWKLGMTSESALYLRRAGEQYEQIQSEVGQGSVSFEQGVVCYRTYEFAQARKHLAKAREIFTRLGEHVELARTLNVMSRLVRIDPYQPQYEAIRFDEAQRRGEEALRILNERDWFVGAEINLSLCILHYVWGIKLQHVGQTLPAQQHFQQSWEYTRRGWEHITNVTSPMLASVYHGMQGNLFVIDKDWKNARVHFLEELVCATQTKHMRLMRGLDLLEDALVAQPPAEAHEHAHWLIDTWRSRGLAEKYPHVEKAIQWMIDHQSYILPPDSGEEEKA